MMDLEGRLVSYYEISSDLSVRLGSGCAETIFSRDQALPGIRVCVWEPITEQVEFRMRIGIVTLTDDGIVDKVPEDESERRGVWAASFPAALGAMDVLQSMSLLRLREIISTGQSVAWVRVDFREAQFRPVQDPISDWSARDDNGAIGPQVLVRLAGEPEQLAEVLGRIRDESALHGARANVPPAD